MKQRFENIISQLLISYKFKNEIQPVCIDSANLLLLLALTFDIFNCAKLNLGTPWHFFKITFVLELVTDYFSWDTCIFISEVKERTRFLTCSHEGFRESVINDTCVALFYDK